MVDVSGILNTAVLKKMLPLLAVVVLVAAVCGVLFLRAPVLFVTDASFYQVYGTERFNRAIVRNSLSLFRRIIPVPVTENAASDVIALVAESAARAPHAVIFPQRYINAAIIYSGKRPQTPALVTWGRNPLPQSFLQTTSLVFVRTDSATDLYRAGAAVAVLSQETNGVLFFTDEGIDTPQNRQVFGLGLALEGFTEEPVFIDAQQQPASYSGIGSIIVAGPASDFLDRALEIPIILFSWVDPVFTPHTVKIVFNDSPLAVLTRAIRALSPPQREIFVPSHVHALSHRIEEKKEFRRIRKLLKSSFP
ncbi:MAG: hypothetical protein FWD91_06380 [Treponema sp.]|nr:hypothetical protein [Treponema sp.]